MAFVEGVALRRGNAVLSDGKLDHISDHLTAKNGGLAARGKVFCKRWAAAVLIKGAARGKAAFGIGNDLAFDCACCAVHADIAAAW